MTSGNTRFSDADPAHAAWDGGGRGTRARVPRSRCDGAACGGSGRWRHHKDRASVAEAKVWRQLLSSGTLPAVPIPGRHGSRGSASRSAASAASRRTPQGSRRRRAGRKGGTACLEVRARRRPAPYGPLWTTFVPLTTNSVAVPLMLSTMVVPLWTTSILAAAGADEGGGAADEADEGGGADVELAGAADAADAAGGADGADVELAGAAVKLLCSPCAIRIVSETDILLSPPTASSSNTWILKNCHSRSGTSRYSFQFGLMVPSITLVFFM